MKRRLLVAVPMIAATVLLLSGCGVANVITPPYTSAIYATVADGAGADQSVAIPSWVQADATYVRIKTDVTHNASIMTFSTPAPTSAGAPCENTNLPSLNETWWPLTLPTDGISCNGTWHFFASGNQYFAWSP